MLSKTFDPAEAEPRIYAGWEESGAFKPAGDGAPFAIVIPPPNVTGSLHIGHALNNTLQDVLVRFERMRGKRTLWQPGTDHAGIATQMVVERRLAAEGNVSRRELGREEFLKRVWAWKAESGGAILNQLKRLGASCDWSRERFTMDDGLSAAVRKVFVELHREGLIYRDKRLVNWDPHFQTAISDLEVESREVAGHLWHFAYPLEDGSGEIVVATTRPETMLGDTGVAVHPDDERYKNLVGKKVRLPIVGRLIPIVADEYADPEQGSGAVKITPAHDFNDFKVGERQGLDKINIFTETAHLTDGVPEAYRGMERFAARKKVVAEMDELGLLRKIEDKIIMQPFGDRSGVVIEPYLTDQWYVDAKTLAQPAIKAVRDGRTKFTPANWSKTYFNWMENIEPWCVSRQLWWGHRIPAWYGPKKVEYIDGSGWVCDLSDRQIFVEETEEAAVEAARSYYEQDNVTAVDSWRLVDLQWASGSPTGNIPIARDEDVLDTWFSSGLWPFSTLGWPDETPELKAFYPTSVLVTAFDIIFFWVARMMMMGLKFMGEVPFHDVYIHALVRDEKGQKMSKSKGNVIDPLELIDEYGADAVRFTLAALAAQGRDIRMSRERVEGYRNFGTKVWNAARFCQLNGCAPVAGWDPAAARLTVNRWIIGEAVETTKAVTAALEDYRFNDAAAAVYRFAWNIYCDWYVELIKPALSGSDGAAKDETRACAAWVLDQVLTLLHPFIPFVTEELWTQTAGEAGRAGALITAPWPAMSDKLVDADARAEIDWLVRLVTEIRSVRADMNVPPAAKAPLVAVGADKAVKARLETHEEALLRLARLDGWALGEAAPKGAVQVVVDGVVYALPLGDVVDLDAERGRLSKEIKRLDGEIDRLVKKLSNERFVSNAPEDVVAAERDKQAGYEAERVKLETALKRLEEAA